MSEPRPRWRISAEAHDLFVHAGGRAGWTFAVYRQSDGVCIARGRLSRPLGAVQVAAPLPAATARRLVRLLARLRWRARWRIDAGASRAGARRRRRLPARDAARAPLEALATALAPGYAEATGLTPQRERVLLRYAGVDATGRPCWLAPETVRAWRRLSAAAAADGVTLALVSGFRSRLYQARILATKLARGLARESILAVNAAPGYSEHHSGRAIDIGTPGCAPAEPDFEHTAAYAWLSARAAGYGFRLSYPRGNPHGIVFEPWHWLHVGPGGPTPN